MGKLDEIQKRLLELVAGFCKVPEGALNLRVNGQCVLSNSTSGIEVRVRDDGLGLSVSIRPGTKNESVHIPVLISESGLTETVYNDFFIGEDSDVVIVAGCAIHNCGGQDSRHDGIHRFHVGKNARVQYLEKHYGEGEGGGGRIMNPGTWVYLEENGVMKMEMIQIAGVDSTKRETKAELRAGARLVIQERLMTQEDQEAKSSFLVNLSGLDSRADVVSRTVARDRSRQTFLAEINGNSRCAGHSECDAIILDEAYISAVPKITANHAEAVLIHEAAIGKIAGDQLMKLMSLGLSQAEAEAQIINGFLS